MANGKIVLAGGLDSLVPYWRSGCRTERTRSSFSVAVTRRRGTREVLCGMERRSDGGVTNWKTQWR